MRKRIAGFYSRRAFGSVLLALSPLMGHAGQNYQVYVSNEKSGDLTVINGSDNTVAATFPVGKRPRGLRASPDDETLCMWGCWRYRAQDRQRRARLGPIPQDIAPPVKTSLRRHFANCCNYLKTAFI